MPPRLDDSNQLVSLRRGGNLRVYASGSTIQPGLLSRFKANIYVNLMGRVNMNWILRSQGKLCSFLLRNQLERGICRTGQTTAQAASVSISALDVADLPRRAPALVAATPARHDEQRLTFAADYDPIFGLLRSGAARQREHRHAPGCLGQRHVRGGGDVAGEQFAAAQPGCIPGDFTQLQHDAAAD